MKKISFKIVEIYGVLFGVMFGSILHFLYEWSGKNVFVGVFSAVNESPWEHLKLFFVPVILFLVVEWFFVKNKKTLLLAKVIETLFGILFITAFFYTYSGALGVEYLIVDILSFIVAVMIGKYISFKIVTSKINWQGYTSLHVAVLLLLILFFTFVTFIPPKVPLFFDHNIGNYGIQK